MLFAQAAQNVLSADASTWVGMVGTLGFAVWYGYYVTSVTIPKINSDNNALVAKIVADFKDEMKLERESHAADMTAQRDECRREVEQLMTSFRERLQARIDPSKN